MTFCKEYSIIIHGGLIIKKLVLITLIVLCTMLVENVGGMEAGGLSASDVIDVHFIEYLYQFLGLIYWHSA